jgi:hypothetical protein
MATDLLTSFRDVCPADLKKRNSWSLRILKTIHQTISILFQWKLLQYVKMTLCFCLNSYRKI